MAGIARAVSISQKDGFIDMLKKIDAVRKQYFQISRKGKVFIDADGMWTCGHLSEERRTAYGHGLLPGEEQASWPDVMPEKEMMPELPAKESERQAMSKG